MTANFAESAPLGCPEITTTCSIDQLWRGHSGCLLGAFCHSQDDLNREVILGNFQRSRRCRQVTGLIRSGLPRAEIEPREFRKACSPRTIHNIPRPLTRICSNQIGTSGCHQLRSHIQWSPEAPCLPHPISFSNAIQSRPAFDIPKATQAANLVSVFSGGEFELALDLDARRIRL